MNRNCLLSVVLSTAGLQAAEIPSGQIAEIRLTSGVSSADSKAGDIVSAELISPIVLDGQVLVSAGTPVQGRVSRVTALGYGLKNGRAVLGLQFDLITPPSGDSVPIRTVLEKLDTSREKLSAEGHINGISPALSTSSALAAYAWRLMFLDPAVGAAVWAIKFALAPAPDPEIRLPVGTELLIRFLESAPLPQESAVAELPMLDPTEADNLRDGLESTPLRVTRKNGVLGDRINIAIAGEQEAIQRAFAAAGWSASEARNVTSLAKTYYHIVQRKGYSTAPMSPMTYDGHQPAMTFQKALNTFSRRHHLRVWKTKFVYAGLPVWAVAATEDVDVHFSKESKRWTHEIDYEIDHERAKVLSDLLYTGCVQASSLIDIAALDTPEFVTDGAIAGVRLNACETPRRMPVATRGPKGNRFARAMKAICKDAVRSNLGNIAVTSAHVPPQAFAAKSSSGGERGTWAQQQATLLSRRIPAE